MTDKTIPEGLTMQTLYACEQRRETLQHIAEQNNRPAMELLGMIFY